MNTNRQKSQLLNCSTPVSSRPDSRIPDYNLSKSQVFGHGIVIHPFELLTLGERKRKYLAVSSKGTQAMANSYHEAITKALHA